MAKKKKGLGKIAAAFLGLVIGFVGGFYFLTWLTIPDTEDVNFSYETYYSKGEDDANPGMDISDADLSFHFLELGNKYTGDCTYVKAGDVDILIDCGSKSNSVQTVAKYLENYVVDGVLEYVIVTHAHQDHYAGFATSGKVKGIFDLFKCETIIDFAGTTNSKKDTKMYQTYQANLQKEIEEDGATHLTALECINGQSTFDLASGIRLEILDTGFYANPDSSNENNNSVCCMFTHQISATESRNFLFTGDLEKEGEANLCNLDLPEVDLYKAGHHGSGTSSTKEFIDKIKPKVVCVCCCAGSSEYTDNVERQFPTQAFIDNVGAWTDKIYVTTMCVDYINNEFTSFNGNIVYLSSNGTEPVVNCSNNNTILKNSQWFKDNGRIWHGV